MVCLLTTWTVSLAPGTSHSPPPPCSLPAAWSRGEQRGQEGCQCPPPSSAGLSTVAMSDLGSEIHYSGVCSCVCIVIHMCTCVKKVIAYSVISELVCVCGELLLFVCVELNSLT